MQQEGANGNGVRNSHPRLTGRPYDEESYGFAKLTTKSVENILEPRLYDLVATPIVPEKKSKKHNMANISDKIKTMSSRTQKLFARIYNSAHPKQAAEEENDTPRRPIFGGKAATCRVKMPKSRRSLSYGNIPGLEDFKQVLKEIDQLDESAVPAPLSAATDVKPATAKTDAGHHRLHDEVKDDLLDGCEDTDSGILVNESGQSSIIETDDVFLPEGYIKLSARGVRGREAVPDATTQQDVNSNIEFKFVRLPVDTSYGLGIGIKAISSELSINRRMGYQVANISKGGMVER